MKNLKRIQLLTCALMALCITGISCLLILHYRASQQSRATYKAALVLDTLAAASAAQLAGTPWDELRSISSRVFEDEEIHQLSITLPDHSTPVDLTKEGNPSTRHLETFSTTVQADGKELGTINLVLNQSAARQRTTMFTLEVLAGALLITGLLWLLMVQITPQLHAPLNAITQAIERANEGDYSTRMAVPVNTEFEQLASNFNQLINNFADQQHRLTVYADEIAEKNIQMSKQISERMNAEAAFQDTQVRYQAVFDQTFQHTGLIGLDGNTLELNTTALELFNFDREDMLGESFIKRYGRRFRKSDREAFNINFSKALAGNLVADEWSIIKPGAQKCFIDYTLKPILDDNGQVSLILYEANDITAMKEAEAALVESELQIRQSQKMEAVGRLAGGIAHDFNNLLTSILGYSELIQDYLEADHSAREDLSEIIHSAQRAKDLTQRLLTLSRKRRVQRQPLHLNSLIEDLDKLIKVSMDERVEYVKDLDHTIPYIQADKVSIEQIIVNLAINSSHAMEGKDGRLTIQTQRASFQPDNPDKPDVLETGDYVLMVITDTGCGMTDEVKERAFEPFFTTKQDKGTGLGLSTVYGIVKQLGGHILLDSAPGSGTALRIYLPASDAVPLEILDEPRELSDLRGTETLLVVEDEESVRRLTVKIASSLGYMVLTAQDGAEALTVAHNVDYQIDLILTDVVMPKKSGPEFIHELIARGHSLPHIYMTGFPRDKLSFMDESDDSIIIIQKPFTREYLASRLRECIDKHAALQTANSTPVG